MTGQYSQVSGTYILVGPHERMTGEGADPERQVAMKTKLVPNNVLGQVRMSFVTEGEVSLQFVIEK